MNEAAKNAEKLLHIGKKKRDENGNSDHQQ